MEGIMKKNSFFPCKFLPVILFVFLLQYPVTKIYAEQVPGDKAKVIYDLIERIIPGKSAAFVVEIVPGNGKDYFELEGRSGKIVLRGNNGVSAASAFNYYLKNYVHCDLSWNGNNLKLPEKLPAVTAKVREESPYKYRYYFNYCTFNYTASWWDWERWEKEIDLMALNGINMPLALTGQNAVWKRVYKKMGLTDKDLDSFFSGPAYFSWFWMGNLDGYNGPLPDSWMKSHEQLQKKILARERELGMTPILPSFSGHVPAAFKDKFPETKLIKVRWDANGFDTTYSIAPSDTMFTYIGSEFMKEQINTYGTDHYYSSDTFNENEPPTNDPAFLNGVSKKVYESMAGVDPDAIWVMQGWLFYNNAKFWQPAQAKALLDAVPDNKMIVLDLFAENYPVWNKTNAFYGKSWIWCMLHNFGGNNNLYGAMDAIGNEPLNTLKNSKSGNMAGIGITAEAIELNPALYEMMLENSWRNEKVDAEKWVNGYAERRYGKQNINAEKAWQILLKTVYTNEAKNNYHSTFIIRPDLNMEFADKEGILNMPYQPADLIPAWENMLEAAPDLKGSEGFRYDLVDVTRQILVDYGNEMAYELRKAFDSKDKDKFKILSVKYLELFDDMDRLLAAQKGFILGTWINDAKKWGTNKEETALYEKNARNLVTLWGDKDSPLKDYSRRQWSGLMKDFYKPRWERFFAYSIDCLENNKQFDLDTIDEINKEAEWKWVNEDKIYPDKPVGDQVETAKQIHEKYIKDIKVLAAGK
jgi:alpha-N-acetylglucosaminidase